MALYGLDFYTRTSAMQGKLRCDAYKTVRNTWLLIVRDDDGLAFADAFSDATTREQRTEDEELLTMLVEARYG